MRGRDPQRGRIRTGAIPKPIADHILRTTPLTPRSEKSEEHGAIGPKIRLIGDFRAIGINDLLELVDTYIPDGIDARLAMAALYANANPRAEIEIRAFSVDSENAYNQVPLQASMAEFANIALRAPGGAIAFSELRTQPFGSARVPAN